MPLEAGTAFKLVRAAEKTALKQLEAVEAKLAAALSKADASAVDTKEVQDLREKVERYEKELAVVNVEATEQFQKTVGQPLKAAEDTLMRLASKANVTEAALRTALAEPDDNKRSDILSELSAPLNRIDTATFDRTIADMATLQRAKANALSSAASSSEQARAERERVNVEADTAFRKDWENARVKAFTTLAEDQTSLGVLFKPTGDEKFDASVTEAVERVQKLDISKLPNESIAERFYKAEVLPLALKMVSSQHTQIETLQAELASLRGATPSVGDGTPAPIVPGPTQIPPGASFASVVGPKLDGIIPR